jgi:large subunit ribosomal protein L25
MTAPALTLQVTPREKGGKLENARKQGLMPGVFYGKGKPATAVFIDVIEFQKIYKTAGQSSIVTLKSDKTSTQVLIHEVTRNTITGLPSHADFMIVDTTHTMHAEVPLEFVGEAPAIKTHKATLVKNIHEVEVEAMAADLPHSITVDTSTLVDLDSHITLADLKLPKGVSINGKADTIVASLSAETPDEVEDTALVPEEVVVEK